MGLGYLKIVTRTLNEVLPVKDVSIIVKDTTGNILYRLKTDESGNSPTVELKAPEKRHTLSPNYSGPYYYTYDVELNRENFITKIIKGIQIFDTITSILPVIMIPKPLNSGNLVDVIGIPETLLYSKETREQKKSEIPETRSGEIAFPKHLIVHLGVPDEEATNIRVKFSDYIKNVASSEIYPTWPQASLEANIYTIITFTLHRLCSRHYRNSGHNFDITNSATHDQAFTEGREIPVNIAKIVDKIINSYISDTENKKPCFTNYCNGIENNLAGLSKWGTVPLANRGLSSAQILKNYYPENIEIIEVIEARDATITDEDTARLLGINEKKKKIDVSELNKVLKLGDEGKEVGAIQNFLTYISEFYNEIPDVLETKMFDEQTRNTVIEFQKLFGLTKDGIVGNQTWTILGNVYNGIIENI